MTVYKGKVNCRKFGELLHTILLAEGYTEVSTEITTDGRVYRSSPTNEDLFFIKVKDPVNRYLTVGVYEKYEPSTTVGLPGTFTNGFDANCVIWNTSINQDRVDVQYIINANNKRVIIWVDGMPAESGRMNSITYIGLPRRAASTDKDGRFAGLSYSSNGPYSAANRFYSLRNRNEASLFAYHVDFYMPSRSLGWGNKLFFSPMIVGSAAEGMRGTLDGIRIIERTDKNMEILAGDTFMHDGKEYMLIQPTSHGYDTIHIGYDYLIEI